MLQRLHEAGGAHTSFLPTHSLMRRETVSACPPRLREGAPGSLTLGNTVQGNAAEMPHMLQSLHEGGGAAECSDGMWQILYPQPCTETICKAICSQSLHEGERAKKTAERLPVI